MKNLGQLLRRRIRASRKTAGQSLLETALVFPILLIMLVGSADLAQLVYSAIEVSNAAKAGVQYGCESGFTAQDSTGISTAASAEASNLTLTTSSSFACVCSDGTSSTCANTDCAGSHIEETLTVTSQAAVTPLIHLPTLPATYTLHGQAIQRVEQ